MALTVTTDLTVMTTAETITGWVAIGAQTPVLEPDFFVQGANCVSRAVSGVGTVKGMVFDNGAGIDFTTGTHKDKLVYIWMRVNTAQLAETRANAGVTVRLCTTSATADFREWNVDGKDTIPATEGWICYVVDPQSAGTATTGSYSAANVRFFGGTLKTTTSAKGQNLGIDQISYGRGELYVSGTVTTAGQGFKEIAAVAYDAAGTNRWGIITEKAGVFYVRGKIILGHATASTTFSSRGETVVWETPSYKDATNVVKLIPDASVGGTLGSDGKTTYNGIGFIGGSGTTTIDFGTIVGTDSGRSGSTLVCALNAGLTTPGRTLATVTVDNSTMALSLYASTFANFEGQIDLTGTGIVNDDCFACTFNGCGRIDSNMEIRNANVLNSVATTTDGALIWSDTTNLQKGVFAGNSRAVVFEAITGTPFAFTGITFSGNTFDVRNESEGAITINVSDGTTPTVENIGASTTTVVVNPVTFSVTVKDLETSAVIQNARVMVPVTTSVNFPYQAPVTITGSGTTATVAHTGHGLATNDNILIAGATEDVFNGAYTITKINNDSYSYTAPGTLPASASGTITATMVLLNGFTNASGVITDSRTYSAAQPVSGWVRRHTYGPSYTSATWTDATSTLTKTGAFTGMSGTFLITITAGTNMTPGVYLATWVNANDVTLPGGAGSADSSNVAFTIGAQPLYRQAPVAGDVSNTDGLTVTVFLQPDE